MSLQKISGSGLGGIYVVNDQLGYQTAEKIRQSINSLAAVRASLPLLKGGARTDLWRGDTNGVAFKHPNWWDVVIDWTEMAAGWTVVARTERVCEDATGAVTVTIKNVTDAVDYAGVALASTSWTEDLITIPVPGALGVKRYQLWMTDADITKGGNADGVIEVYA